MTSDTSTQGSRQQIRAHIERELGTIKQVFREATDDPRAIEVVHVAASVERPVHTLVTTGMSDQPMNTAGDSNAPRYIELMMTLPREWKLTDVSPTDASCWPVRTLTSLARLPQQRGSALAWGQVVPNGDPPAPYAPDTKLCGVILAPSLLVPKEFYALEASDRRIEFYAAIPLYAEEMQLHQQQGMEHLLSTLIDHRINDLVEIKRRNITRKRFGIF